MSGSTRRSSGTRTDDDGEGLRAAVRERYGEAARRAAAGERAACGPAPVDGAESACGCGCGTAEGADPITSDLYSAAEADGLPAGARLASLGCGNPTALAELAPGQTVLDLGSGGGIDVLLSARRVAPGGRAYGLDMSDEMLELARANQREAGVENVEFLKGEIEAIPLPDDSVDVIISNCVINLSADKAAVLAEAYRVLRPGGRFAVSDIVVRGPVDARIRENAELWVGCVAGALEEEEYRRLLADAGFTAVEIEPTRVYGEEDMRDLATPLGSEAQALARDAAGKFMSAFVRATKPGRSGS